MAEERIQHGIDNDPNNDAKKGATLGGVGGAVTGAVAGSAVGPVGTVIGAAIGGVAGAVASGAAVHEVDKVDNDNTVTGLGEHESRVPTTDAGNTYNNVRREGVQTGGHDYDGSPDTRGVSEKVADAVTGDNVDDKTGKPVD